MGVHYTFIISYKHCNSILFIQKFLATWNLKPNLFQWQIASQQSEVVPNRKQTGADRVNHTLNLSRNSLLSHFQLKILKPHIWGMIYQNFRCNLLLLLLFNSHRCWKPLVLTNFNGQKAPLRNRPYFTNTAVIGVNLKLITSWLLFCFWHKPLPSL